jgi:acetoin utilization protein AcuB
MRAADLMTEDPVSVSELTTVKEALDLLYELDVRHLPVVRGDELVGILSDRDLRRYQSSGNDDEEIVQAIEDPRNPTVSTLMNTNPAQVDPETEAAEIVELMLLHKVGALPVVDAETNQLLGIVSYVDLLRILQDALSS